MFKDIQHRVKKSGLPPGTAVYTGDIKQETEIEASIYNVQNVQEVSGKNLDCVPENIPPDELIWINLEGLYDVEPVKELAARYQLHPLTVEDILNVGQRSKVEEFDDYLFVTLKMLHCKKKSKDFQIDQLSIVLGKNFLLSFQEQPTDLFDDIRKRLLTPKHPLRQQGVDYLAYRLIDTVIDNYFIVLENMGDKIEALEELIINSPTQKNARTLYQLKRQLLLLRKSIWPMRETISHLLQLEDRISSNTRLYLRDVYDHTIQALDTLETFRDLLENILDVYLSSITNRMNEIMKVLTIISTIFIPMTFIASIFGMNFKYMPELHWHWGYPGALMTMGLIAIGMLTFFRRKKWL